MVKGNNIHKHFNNLHVLKGVDINIDKGEFVSIVGDSGAGKTTLLQIIGTLELPSENPKPELHINDIDISKLNEKSLANFRNENIGFVFQFHQLLPEFTAFENICIPGYIKKTNSLELEKKIAISGGTTEAALKTFKKKKALEKIVYNSVKSAYNRALMLGKK